MEMNNGQCGQNRIPISNLVLPEMLERRVKRAERSESISYVNRKKKNFFNSDRKSLQQRTIEQDDMLENIRLKMSDPDFQSDVISQDVATEIQRFENINCFKKTPSIQTHNEKLVARDLAEKQKTERRF